jgi:hypothetical protein
MNVPVPPTDNLYKYMALVGTIMVCASVYFPRVLLREAEEKLNATGLKIDTTKIEIKYFEHRVASLGSIIDHAASERIDVSGFRGKPITLKYSDTELKAILTQVDELERSTEISVAEVKHLNERDKALSKECKEILWYSYGFVFGGIVLALWGYSLWYFRIQIYQDKALKHSANKPNAAA